MNNQRIRTYSELILLPTFEERYEYLKLSGRLGASTFGFDRYLNQAFYNSIEWKRFRNEIIIRDGACDLGVPGYDIVNGIRIHHLNPLTLADFEEGRFYLFMDPEFVICTSLNTHNAIHFGDKSNLIQLPKERREGDTTLWRRY